MKKKTPLVLVIEDDPVTLELMTRSLWISGIRTREAATAAQAVDAARRERPDLIVADIGLPDMDGAILSTCLREDPARGRIPVILVSARDEEELEERKALSGAFDTLPKPFTPVDLLRRVRRALDAIPVAGR